MARRVGKLQLSPNEEAQLIQQERERRRILRIQQVREQQKNFALQTRQNVEQRRQHELELLGQVLREEWEQQQSEKLRTLQMLYEQSLEMVGQGQRMAKENEPDLAAITRREALNHVKAEERFREALKELKSQRLKESEIQSRTINARKKALQVEKERSTKMANLPPPPPNPILQALDSGKSHIGKKSITSDFAVTRFHMPVASVDRAVDAQQADVHEGAELEMKKLLDVQRDGERKRAEQIETARLRGKSALKKEHLALDQDRLLVELERMQQADMLRRRQQMYTLPPQIFQPPHRKQEMKDDFQRDMEFAFVQLYTKEKNIKGDQVGRLIPEPLPVASISSQDPELDVTHDEIVPSDQEKSKVDPGSQDPARVDTTRHAPRQALKNLLNRIRNQRNEVTSCNNALPAARSLVTVTSRVSEWDTKVIPERDTAVGPEGIAKWDVVVDKEAEQDTTIDTGSLSSQPTQPPLASQEKPIPADTQHHDALSTKIFEFQAERKKREMELEQEKQEQVALLQVLEEQKAQLERLLLEAQQEGKHPKTAVTQEIPLNQTEVPPVCGQELSQHSEPLTPDHTRKIRECQERLLEQSRLHQQSMDLARRRLEEYQRALQIRHNIATHLPSAEPRITSEVASRPSSDSSLPTHLPFSSVSQTSSLQPVEPLQNLNAPRYQIQDVSDSASLTRKVVSRVAERARSLSAITESLPSEAVVKKLLPPKPVTRELLPPEVVTRVLNYPQVSATESRPPQVVTRELLLPEVVTRASIPPQVSITESVPPQVMSRESLSFKMVTRESLNLKAVPREPVQMVTAEPSPQVVPTVPTSSEMVTTQPIPVQMSATKSVPIKMVTGESLQTKAVTREVLPPQAVTRESFKPVTTEFLPYEPVTTSLPFRPIQTVTESCLSQTRSPEKENSDQQRPQELREQQQQEGKSERLEELRQKQRESLELMRQQKETLQALIHVDAQSGSEALAPEDVGRTRLELLSSLLRVIEKSNAVSLSCPKHLQAESSPSLQLPSTSKTGLLHPPARVAKPPVTRVRLSMMREQHELSAIQEVETPVDTSQLAGPEDVFAVPQHTVDWSLPEPYESSVTTEQTLQTTSISSRRSTPSLCREKPVMGTGTSPESSEHGSYQYLSCVSERGSEYFGSSFSDATRPPGEASHLSSNGPPDQECLSATTLSTGSYITSDAEANTGKSPNLGATSTSRLGMSSSPAVAPPQPAHTASQFHGGNVQRIIDQYARELDVSLSSGSKSTVSEGSILEERHSSLSQRPLHRVSGRQVEDDQVSRVTLPSQAAHTSHMNRDQTGHPVLEQLSVCEDQASFRPLIAQLADQSSSLLIDQRDNVMERLVGHPSAHSSMIGLPPGQAGWDTTLSRIMEQVSQESSQRWRRSGQDPSAGRLTSHTELSWLDERLEERSMRLLVEDVSSGQDTGSSGERTSVDLSVLTEATIPTYPSIPLETSHRSSPVTGLNPQSPAADSFHPLPLEVTTNESAVFHNTPDSSNEHTSSDETIRSAHSDSQSQGGDSEDERSTETFRAEDNSQWTSAWCRPDSPQAMQLSQSGSSHTSSPFSILPVEDVKEERQGVEGPIWDPHAEVKSERSVNLRMDLNTRLQEAGSTKGILEQSQITLVSSTDTTLEDSITPEEVVMWQEEEQKGLEESQTTIVEEPSGPLKEDQSQSPSHAGMLLEFNWSSWQQGVFEEKRRALLERSIRRAEEVKARGALARTGAAADGIQSGRRPPQARQGAKIDKSKVAKSTLVKQQKPPTPPAVSASTKLKEQSQAKRKQEEMHRRTQRIKIC